MDSDTVMIVELTERDGDAARLVINEAATWYAELLAPDEAPDPEMSPESWRIESERMTWYGAYDGGELIGVVGLEYVADVALLRHWYVLPDWQRSGVGSRLREHVEHQVTGVERLIAGTYDGNYKARRALERAGYQRSVDSDAVLRTYYEISDRRRSASVTYERRI